MDEGATAASGSRKRKRREVVRTAREGWTWGTLRSARARDGYASLHIVSHSNKAWQWTASCALSEQRDPEGRDRVQGEVRFEGWAGSYGEAQERAEAHAGRVNRAAVALAPEVTMYVLEREWQGHRAGLLDAAGGALYDQWSHHDRAMRVTSLPSDSPAAMEVLTYCNSHNIYVSLASTAHAVAAR